MEEFELPQKQEKVYVEYEKKMEKNRLQKRHKPRNFWCCVLVIAFLGQFCLLFFVVFFTLFFLKILKLQLNHWVRDRLLGGAYSCEDSTSMYRTSAHKKEDEGEVCLLLLSCEDTLRGYLWSREHAFTRYLVCYYLNLRCFSLQHCQKFLFVNYPI